MAGATGENAESPAASPRQQANTKPSRNRLSCQVTLLDGTVLTTDQLQVSLSFFQQQYSETFQAYLMGLAFGFPIKTYKPLCMEVQF